MKAILLAGRPALTAVWPRRRARHVQDRSGPHLPELRSRPHGRPVDLARQVQRRPPARSCSTRKPKTGTVDITVEPPRSTSATTSSNEHAQRADDVRRRRSIPTATYKGKLVEVQGRRARRKSQGELTLHGVTKPVTLKINQFLCKKHPMTKKEVCGADASGTFNRSDFGVDYGKDHRLQAGCENADLRSRPPSRLTADVLQRGRGMLPRPHMLMPEKSDGPRNPSTRLRADALG